MGGIPPPIRGIVGKNRSTRNINNFDIQMTYCSTTPWQLTILIPTTYSQYSLIDFLPACKNDVTSGVLARELDWQNPKLYYSSNKVLLLSGQKGEKYIFLKSESINLLATELQFLEERIVKIVVQKYGPVVSQKYKDKFGSVI